jgi:RecA-family ATPase
MANVEARQDADELASAAGPLFKVNQLSCGSPTHAIEDLHLHFPDLEPTWLATADRLGKITKTALLQQIEAWISAKRPILVVINSIAAVCDGEAIARRQIRSFLAMLRKIARENETAIVLLDHPSVRGMADGSGTAKSCRLAQIRSRDASPFRCRQKRPAPAARARTRGQRIDLP